MVCKSSFHSCCSVVRIPLAATIHQGSLHRVATLETYQHIEKASALVFYFLPKQSCHQSSHHIFSTTTYHINNTTAYRTPSAIGRAALTNVLQVHSDYYTASSRMRHYRRLVDSEVASADAMEAPLLTDHGTDIIGITQCDRTQHDTALAQHRSASLPIAIRSKNSLAFRSVLVRRAVKEALATSKRSLHTKRIFRPGARQLDDLPFVPQGN